MFGTAHIVYTSIHQHDMSHTHMKVQERYINMVSNDCKKIK